MSGQLEMSPFASVRPNSAEKVFSQIFLNQRFTRDYAKNDVTWAATKGNPIGKYREKSLFYAKTLGVL